MEQKLGVLLARGAGATDFPEQKDFTDDVEKELKKRGVEPSAVAWQYVDWQRPTQERQEELWRRFSLVRPQLKGIGQRHLFLYMISDIVAYTGEPMGVDDAYEKTNRRIFEEVQTLERKLPPDAPLMVIASSLATTIMSNYIWDRQKKSPDDEFGKTSFERMETMAALLTVGNTMPLYMPAHDLDRLKPVAFPGSNLSEQLRGKAIWLNVYDRNDPLGYPLKAVNDLYAKAVTRDWQIRAGNFLTTWNALSHLAYWRTKALRSEVASIIADLLEAANP